MTISAELPKIAPDRVTHRQGARLGRLAGLRTARLRAMVADPSFSRSGWSQLIVTAMLVVPAWAGLAVAASLAENSTGETSGSTAAIRILLVLAGDMVVAAAVVSAVRAWAAHELAPALIGCALSVYGVRTLLQIAAPSPQVGSSPGQSIGSACLVVAFGLILLSVVHEPGKRGGRHPLTFWVASLMVALVTLTVVKPAGSGVLSGAVSGNSVGNLLVAATWAALGGAAIYVGGSERAQLKIWVGFAALCLGQARLSVVLFGSRLGTLSSVVLETVAVAILLIGTVRALQANINQSNGLIRDSVLAFQGSEARRHREADAHEEVVHNLRSALTSIGTATHLLVTDRVAPLGDAERSELTAALLSELDRARRLLSREWDGGRRAFDLADVITPLAVNERARGSETCTAGLTDTVVFGDPDLTYEVIATVLSNARQHAPGSPITIRSLASAEWVTIAIEDRGPGLPAMSEERIFERGWTTSPCGDGKGLGLFVARRLMEQQGGTLTASNRPAGGASFFLCLPRIGAAALLPSGLPDLELLVPGAAEMAGGSDPESNSGQFRDGSLSAV